MFTFHSPYTLESENDLDDELKQGLAFATEKLDELQDLKEIAVHGVNDLVESNSRIHEANECARINLAVRDRCEQSKNAAFTQRAPFAERIQLQKERLKLPLLPTTTIGSFPQGTDLRKVLILKMVKSTRKITMSLSLKKFAA